MPRAVDPAEGEADHLATGRARFLLLLLPATEPTAQVVHLDTERVADVHEGEGPFDVIGLEPLFGFSEDALSGAITGEGVLLERPDPFLEYGQHEALLGLERRV